MADWLTHHRQEFAEEIREIKEAHAREIEAVAVQQRQHGSQVNREQWEERLVCLCLCLCAECVCAGTAVRACVGRASCGVGGHAQAHPHAPIHPSTYNTRMPVCNVAYATLSVTLTNESGWRCMPAVVGATGAGSAEAQRPHGAVGGVASGRCGGTNERTTY